MSYISYAGLKHNLKWD